MTKMRKVSAIILCLLLLSCNPLSDDDKARMSRKLSIEILDAYASRGIRVGDFKFPGIDNVKKLKRGKDFDAYSSTFTYQFQESNKSVSVSGMADFEISKNRHEVKLGYYCTFSVIRDLEILNGGDDFEKYAIKYTVSE